MSGVDRKVGRPRREATAEDLASKDARRRELGRLRNRAYRARQKRDRIADMIDGMVPDWDDDDPSKILAELLRRMRIDLK